MADLFKVTGTTNLPQVVSRKRYTTPCIDDLSLQSILLIFMMFNLIVNQKMMIHSHQVFVNQTWVGGYYQLKVTKNSGQLGKELIKGHGE